MRITRTIQLSRLEFDTVHRIAPSVPVAFPGLHDAEQKRGVEGRHIYGVATRRTEFTAAWMHEAWAEAVTLEALLQNQGAREYWERELRADDISAAHGNEQEAFTGGVAVGLIAPNTDVCGMLAETRQRMADLVTDALPVLVKAVTMVGPVPEEDYDE